MISCEKAAELCNKTQYGEASFLDRWKLKFHLFLCKNCAAHTKKNSQLTALCQKANLHSLTEQEKLKMKEQLQQKS